MQGNAPNAPVQSLSDCRTIVNRRVGGDAPTGICRPAGAQYLRRPNPRAIATGLIYFAPLGLGACVALVLG